MKANTKTTVLEILTAAGVEKPEEKLGAVRVRIGGIPVNKDQLIKVQPGTKTIDVIVGVDKHQVTIEGDEEAFTVSDGAKVMLEAKGAESTKKAEELQKAKAELNSQPE